MSEVIRGDKGYYLLQVIEKKAAETPPLEEVQDRVEKQFRGEQSKNLAEEKAKEVLQAVESGAPGRHPDRTGGNRGDRYGIHHPSPEVHPEDRCVGRDPREGFYADGRGPLGETSFRGEREVLCDPVSGAADTGPGGVFGRKEELLMQQQTRKAQEIYREWLAELRRQKEVKISTGVGA